MNKVAEAASVPARKGQTPQFFSTGDTDMLLAMVVALAGEVAVLRDRLDSHEQLSARQGGYSGADVDAFLPEPELASERNTARQEYLRRVLAPALERARQDRGDTVPLEDIVQQVTGEMSQ